MADGEWLTREQVIHRDEAGNLVPVEEVVEFLPGNPRIKLLPVSRGKFTSLRDDGGRDQDSRIIREHLVSPKLSEEDLRETDARTLNALTCAIISASTGVDQATVMEKTMSAVKQKAEEFGQKNPQ